MESGCDNVCVALWVPSLLWGLWWVRFFHQLQITILVEQTFFNSVLFVSNYMCMRKKSLSLFVAKSTQTHAPRFRLERGRDFGPWRRRVFQNHPADAKRFPPRIPPMKLMYPVPYMLCFFLYEWKMRNKNGVATCTLRPLHLPPPRLEARVLWRHGPDSPYACT